MTQRFSRVYNFRFSERDLFHADGDFLHKTSTLEVYLLKTWVFFSSSFSSGAVGWLNAPVLHPLLLLQVTTGGKGELPAIMADLKYFLRLKSISLQEMFSVYT